MNQVRQMAHKFEYWLNQPAKVFMACLLVLITALLLNGTLWKLWGLYRDQNLIRTQSVQARMQIASIESQLKQAVDPNFIERQARDKMDLVSDHDMIFVFPE